jgi:hypothetical protein
MSLAEFQFPFVPFVVLVSFVHALPPKQYLASVGEGFALGRVAIASQHSRRLVG